MDTEMAEFILIDLYQQLPFLPSQMETWSRERILRWLAIYGEVYSIADHFEANEQREHLSWRRDHYYFCSWVGLQTQFVLQGPGDMFIPGTRRRAWVKPRGGSYATG
jgi:hypothetical protein